MKFENGYQAQNSENPNDIWKRQNKILDQYEANTKNSKISPERALLFTRTRETFRGKMLAAITGMALAFGASSLHKQTKESEHSSSENPKAVQKRSESNSSLSQIVMGKTLPENRILASAQTVLEINPNKGSSVSVAQTRADIEVKKSDTLTLEAIETLHVATQEYVNTVLHITDAPNLYENPKEKIEKSLDKLHEISNRIYFAQKGINNDENSEEYKNCLEILHYIASFHAELRDREYEMQMSDTGKYIVSSSK